MTGQQYTVIADRTKGEAMWPPREGDRVTYGRDGWGKLVIVRIERPVPTTDEAKRMLLTHPHDGHGPDDTCRDCGSQPSSHSPTHKQIAEARTILLGLAHRKTAGPVSVVEIKQAVYDALALIQNGAER